jgi:hypothetical protein
LVATGFLFLYSCGSGAATVEQKQTLRWGKGKPGCGFSANRDGTYRYGLTAEDVSVTLAIDSQELDKARRRIEPAVTVFLSFRYSGHEAVELDPAKISLEFVGHFHDRQRSLDPDDLASRLQADATLLSEKTAHEVARHPEKKQALETSSNDQIEAVRTMVEFLGTRALRFATLNADH